MTLPFPTNTVGWELARLGRMRWVYLFRTLVVLLAVWNMAFEWMMGSLVGGSAAEFRLTPDVSVFSIAYVGPFLVVFGSLPFYRSAHTLELLVLAEGGYRLFFLHRLAAAAWHLGMLMALCVSIAYLGRVTSIEFVGDALYHFVTALYMTAALLLLTWYMVAAPARWGWSLACGTLLLVPILMWYHLPGMGNGLAGIVVGGMLLAWIASRAPDAVEDSRPREPGPSRRSHKPIRALLGSTQPLVPLGESLSPTFRLVFATLLLLAVSLSCLPIGQLYLFLVMLLTIFHAARRFGTAELDELRLASISPRLVARTLYVQYLFRTVPLALAGAVAAINWSVQIGSSAGTSSLAFPVAVAISVVTFVSDWLFMVAVGLMTAMSSERTASRIGTAIVGYIVVRGFLVTTFTAAISVPVSMLLIPGGRGGISAIQVTQFGAQPIALLLLAWYYGYRFSRSVQHYWDTGVLTREPQSSGSRA